LFKHLLLITYSFTGFIEGHTPNPSQEGKHSLLLLHRLERRRLQVPLSRGARGVSFDFHAIKEAFKFKQLQD